MSHGFCGCLFRQIPLTLPFTLSCSSLEISSLFVTSVSPDSADSLLSSGSPDSLPDWSDPCVFSDWSALMVLADSSDFSSVSV